MGPSHPDTIPDVPLESVLCTDELDRRPSRPPDYRVESRALLGLAKALADSPRTILQTLADAILDVFQCGSAGVSLLTQDGKRFHWPSIAGAWKAHVGGGTPRDFGPCGDVLDRNAALMMRHIERRYTYFQPVTPVVEECLLVPFYVEGKAVGTIWAVVHDPEARKFDREDLRILESLGVFASSAYWAVEALARYECQTGELREVNESLLVAGARQCELIEHSEKARETIAAKERELSDFFDNASIGLHWVGPDGTILRVNRAELDMLGYGGPGGRERYVGRHIAEFHADRRVIDDILARLMRGETLRDQPARLRCNDGSIRDVVINSSALFDNGRFVHTRCFTHDVTERNRVEEQLREAKRQAEDASHAKDQFLAVLSHELRTPLTPVLMTVAAMEGRDDLPPELRDDVAMIRRNVELQSRLIDDLLDLSRIVSGKLRLNFDAHDVNELVRHACDTCRSNLHERGIRLHCDLHAEPFDVVGDGGRLQQVFWNLLNNATKFTPEGGHVYVTTENTAGAGGEWVRVSVRDTGVGIAPEALERIFNAFEQAQEGQPRMTRQFGGMGLGLAICRALVGQHRGAIHARSDGKGKGSTFVVELPALPRDAGAATGPRSSEPEKINPLRLLVVEDHADTAAVLARLLAASGHSVRSATTAAEALKLAGEEPFDLVVSDIGLPDMTGYELMKQIKQRCRAKGIAMSGYGMEADFRKSEQAGFSDHLVKPLNFAQLEQSICRVVRNSTTSAI